MAQTKCPKASEPPQSMEDHSLLIKPINVGLSGAHHVLQSIRNGTAEVRDLLLNECDLIYECRMCKSLHRSLANFLAHKRVYCTLHCCESMMLFSQDDIEQETVIVQPESPDSGTAVNDDAMGDEPDVEADQSVQQEVIPSPAKIYQASNISKEKHKQKTAYPRGASAVDFHAKCVRHVENRNANRTQVTIKLEQIEDSGVAVMQTVLPAVPVAVADIKTAEPVVVDKPNPVAVSHIADKPNTAKVISKQQPQRHKTQSANLGSSSESSGGAKTYMCCKCNSQFSSAKSMSFHVKTIHAKRRVYFHCPYCKSQFSQMYGVNRHMMSVHKKSKEQVGRLRSKIQKSALLRLNAGGSNSDNEDETNNNDRKERSLVHASSVRLAKSLAIHRCSKCDKIFTDKRTLDSHRRKCTGPNHRPLPRSTSSCVDARAAAKVQINERPRRAVKKKDAGDFVDSSRLNVITNVVASNKGDNVNKAPPAVEKKILEIIDTEKLSCIHCRKSFMNLSNLRRHAAAHIGWNRFKCKHCDYQSYSRSDCRSHVKRKHITKPRQHTQLDSFVVDLPAEEVEKSVANGDFKLVASADRTTDKPGSDRGSDVRSKRLSDSWSSCEESDIGAGKAANTSTDSTTTTKNSVATPASFNISTRLSPRTFDTSPYRRSNTESVLVTRSGSYPKPNCKARKELLTPQPDREYQKVLRTKVIQLKPPAKSSDADSDDHSSNSNHGSHPKNHTHSLLPKNLERGSPPKNHERGSPPENHNHGSPSKNLDNGTGGLFSNYDDHNYSVEVKFPAAEPDSESAPQECVMDVEES